MKVSFSLSLLLIALSCLRCALHAISYAVHCRHGRPAIHAREIAYARNQAAQFKSFMRRWLACVLPPFDRQTVA